MSINDAVTLAIQENLPSAVAGELTKYIAEAEANVLRIKRLEEFAETAREDLKQKNKLIKAYEDTASTYSDLKAKEHDINIRERNLEISILQIKVAESEKRAEGIHRLAETVFKNRSLTKNETMSVPILVPGSNGGSGYTTTQTQIAETVISDRENDTI